MKALQEGSMNLTYPIFKDPFKNNLKYFLPTNLGNLSLTEEGDIVVDATSLRLYFVLDPLRKPKQSDLWQASVLEHILKKVISHFLMLALLLKKILSRIGKIPIMKYMPSIQRVLKRNWRKTLAMLLSTYPYLWP